ncbi:AIM24 family protein [Mechercharimyces sp. CAU 1602]|uniref:AIM24 family protein n=1 Tax=Mechercharimyces sp. CAU 1602 TaxID=2973933 RepID=UPI002163D6F7|nr:AIM24 family protein [Mechercharimyces sp. CAU 1602]MCS1351918.1 AIM24 family protein [Mechercharimyces sp. CAU 1602]
MPQSLDHLLQEAEEVEAQESFVLQNGKALKICVKDSVFCRAGSMIAYQGDIRFESTSGGFSKWIKKKMTGEGVPLMKAEGEGDLFLADDAAEITILKLNNETLFVEGRHLLAFEKTIEWDISMIKGAGMASGGLFTCRLFGTGYVAISSHGEPIALDTPVVVDPNAVIGWTAGVSPKAKADINLKTLMGRSSGETFQLHCQGKGKVLVQPAELVSFGESR